MADLLSIHADELVLENQKLKERTRCKVCLDDVVTVVFLPCMHLVCCARCAPALTTCPVCRQHIKDSLHVLYHDQD